MERKTVTVEIKDADKGEIEAVFSTFNRIDADGDVTLPGAFEDGAEVVISAYGHSSWMGELPVGMGRIKQTDKDARLIGSFFLETTGGKEHFNVIKRLGTKQEWSYGYDVKGTGAVDELPDELQSAERVLTKLKVFEVSPVLVGAGVETRTERVKSAKDDAPTWILRSADGTELTWRGGGPQRQEAQEQKEQEAQEQKEQEAQEQEAQEQKEQEAQEQEAQEQKEQEMLAGEYARFRRTRQKFVP
jgi:hypothetical protein